MSERNQSVSEAVQELSAKVETWEAALKAWPEVVGESVGRALEAAQEQAEERSRSAAQAWARERRAWNGEMERQLQSLTALIERQSAVIRRYEAETAPWVLGWSRDRWRGAVMNVAVTLGLSILLLTLFWWTGPPARDRAALEAARGEVTTCREIWAVMTEAERAEFHKRIRGAKAEASRPAA